MALRACVSAAATAAFVLAVAAAGMPSTAAASGHLLDVRVIDRARNVELPVIRHQGQLYVAGTPGTEYSVMLRSRAAGDLLAVLSVDGVNAVSGETARPDQTGYVLRPRQQAEIRGWRKDLQRTAAFHFTTLPDSYAARTGRPDDVGVIGVAVFRAATPPALAIAPRHPARAGASDSGETMARQRPDAASAGSASAAEAAAAPSAPLGTGHGRTEHSPVRHAQFERASSVPDEVVTIFYDSRANLVARGILPAPLPPVARAPQPFPGFVPDPPPR
ncbi:MAG: hypothetical protein K2W80_11780 [Burkholderiales bacterium]|nr:hypothetical protein [Burkholderiales bacterium]